MSPSKEQFSEAIRLWTEWNARINVVSRKDTDMLYEHHVLHSLGIAKAINFRPGTKVLDFGCGGGFPGDVPGGFHGGAHPFPRDGVRSPGGPGEEDDCADL